MKAKKCVICSRECGECSSMRILWSEKNSNNISGVTVHNNAVRLCPECKENLLACLGLREEKQDALL